MRQLNICLCGLGTVGGEVFKALNDPKRKSLLEQRAGVALHLHTVSARRAREYDLSAYRYTPNVVEAVRDDEIHLVIESIGGIDTALSLARDALTHGKHLITANKDLLANHGDELFALARKHKTTLRWEAAVGGGIPVVQALHSGLLANRIATIRGIINGTSNYVLSAMSEKGQDFDSALGKAQELGYAEADPSFDIGGMDAAHKLLLLAAVAWGVPLKGIEPVALESISKVTQADIFCAHELGYVIKPLALAMFNAENKVVLRVAPTLVSRQSGLSKVHGADNGIWIEGDMVGATAYLGAGAGGKATSSAMLADLGAHGRGESCWFGTSGDTELAHNAHEQLTSAHYMRFCVEDKPGVLSDITSAISEHNINVAQVWQGKHPTQEGQSSANKQTLGGDASVAFITKPCEEVRVLALLEQMQRKSFLREPPVQLLAQEALSGEPAL